MAVCPACEAVDFNLHDKIYRAIRITQEPLSVTRSLTTAATDTRSSAIVSRAYMYTVGGPPSDRAMRLVSSNLANYHATVQKLLIRQVKFCTPVGHAKS